MGAHFVWHLEQLMLKPNKLAYHLTLAAWLGQLTASTFIQLGQYASIYDKSLLLCRTHCFLPGIGCDHCQYLFTYLLLKGWPG